MLLKDTPQNHKLGWVFGKDVTGGEKVSGRAGEITSLC